MTSPDKIEVMIVAGAERLVASHVETMELAGVRPSFPLIVQPITICRVFCDEKSKDLSFFRGVLGARHNDLVYSEQGVLRFYPHC